MACSRGMLDCTARCQHWALVQAYRIERERQENARENAGGVYGPESEEWAAYGPLVTFHEWLQAFRSEAPPLAA